MRTILKLIILLACLASGSVFAANKFVRAGATGANNGSDWTNAYPSLPASLVRGDTYYVSAGGYPGRTFSTPASGSTTITIKKATVADHGTEAGWSDAYATGQAVFNGMLDFTSSYWIVDGQTGGGAGGWNSGFGFKVYEAGDPYALIRVNYSGSANNITVRHVEMQGNGGSSQGGYVSNDGLAIYNSASNVTLSYAWMRNIGRCPVFITGAKSTVIEHTFVESFNPSGGVHGEVMSTGQATMGDLTWRYNLVADIQSTGGLMWDNSTNSSASFYVYGNVFYKPPGASWGAANGVVGGWTGGNGEKFQNVFVYNNTFVNINQESLSTFPNVYSNNVAFNNLFYNSQSPNFSRYGVHNSNLFINSGDAHSEANGVASAGSDPFVNMAAYDFRLKAPTAGGTALQAPFNVDPMGRVRGGDGTTDRGAFEYFAGGQQAAVVAPPQNLTVN